MKEFWNKITSLFLDKIPAYAEKNWLTIELILLVAAVVLFVTVVVLCVSKARKKSQFKALKANDEELLRLKDKEISELKLINEKIKNEQKTEIDSIYIAKNAEIEVLKSERATTVDSLEKELLIAKEMLSEREVELGTKTKECQDRDTKISEMVISHDNLVNAYNKLKEDYDCIKVEEAKREELIESLKDDLANYNDDLETTREEYLTLRDEYANLEKNYLDKVERFNEMAKVKDELVKENDILRNYELENTILLKTIRRLREDDVSEKHQMKDAMVELENRLSKKIESVFNIAKEKVIENNIKRENLLDLENMKRSELSAVAKKVGLTNYATWSNEKLRAEIRKYKK